MGNNFVRFASLSDPEENPSQVTFATTGTSPHHPDRNADGVVVYKSRLQHAAAGFYAAICLGHPNTLNNFGEPVNPTDSSWPPGHERRRDCQRTTHLDERLRSKQHTCCSRHVRWPCCGLIWSDMLGNYQRCSIRLLDHSRPGCICENKHACLAQNHYAVRIKCRLVEILITFLQMAIVSLL